MFEAGLKVLKSNGLKDNAWIKGFKFVWGKIIKLPLKFL